MSVPYEKKYILDQLRQKAIEKRKVFQVQFDVTYDCNAKCFFCLHGDNHVNTRPILSFDEICAVLVQLKEMGCLHIGFSGGEPFLRKDFIDILRFAKKNGFIVTIVSNLQLLTQDELNELIDVGIERISVSCHSIDEAKYCEIFQVSSSYYKQAMNNIAYLVQSNCSIGIMVTVSTVNYGELKDLKKYFIDLGVNERDINFNMLLEGKNSVQQFRDSSGLREYMGANKDFEVNVIKPHDDFLCSAGRISFAINPYGDVFPCSFFNAVAGNVFDTSLQKIWEGSHLFLMLRGLKDADFSRCYGCTYTKYCQVCMANNINETDSITLPSEEYCNFRQSLIDSLVTK